MAKNIPEEFSKIIKDFLNDLLTTFPELSEELDDNLKIIHGENSESNPEAFLKILKYTKTVFPERFFDILYQNDSMFNDDSLNTKFLPNIDFGDLWKKDITDKTRTIIWKYLQLILFIVTNNTESADLFGDTANLFSAINQDEFKSKLEDTLKDMHNMFDMSGINMENMEGMPDLSGINMDNLPNPDEMHKHINDLMGGKIGVLAKEIADEVAKDLDLNPEDIGSTQDVFQKLLKNPAKLMDLVKTVGSKLEEKIKSGEIKQSELLQEAGDMLKKMKEMPGMGSMQSMFKDMGMQMPSGGKMNFGAMESKLNSNIKQAQMRERMLRKLQEKQQGQGTEGHIENKVFSTGENVERTPRSSKPKNRNNKKIKKKKPKN